MSLRGSPTSRLSTTSSTSSLSSEESFDLELDGLEVSDSEPAVATQDIDDDDEARVVRAHEKLRQNIQTAETELKKFGNPDTLTPEQLKRYSFLKSSCDASKKQFELLTPAAEKIVINRSQGPLLARLVGC